MCKKNKITKKKQKQRHKNKNKQTKQTNQTKPNKQKRKKIPQNPEDIKKYWLHTYPGYNNDEVYRSVCYYRPSLHFYRNTTIAEALYHMAC